LPSSKRLIEVAFPLKQASLDSVQEKNVRHGHISTLHIWPARRPLAACRAALIATLLPDPGDDTKRKEILERLGGHVVERSKKKKQADGRTVEEMKEETEGGILHWGRESGPDLEWFRQKIREAYGGRAPRFLDPFAGGGAIPLEAMRLGCEATAVDINPVAWFILKCTLEYPQKLVGQSRPLPEFVLRDSEFMASLFKARGFKGQALNAQLDRLWPDKPASKKPEHKAVELPFKEFSVKEAAGDYNSGVDLSADLAWHVRAWGRWVLAQARRDLGRFYPIYADFEPLAEVAHAVERRPLTLVPLKEDSTPDVDALNVEFSSDYLAKKSNPRWVAKPAVAYLWARTVSCKNCGTLVPLLKTRWLCKKEHKRVLLTMLPLPKEGRNGQLAVQFGVQADVPVDGHTSTERIAHDKELGGGTMSRSGVHCPVCKQVTMTTEDIRLEGQAGRLGAVMTAVVIDDPNGREYRVPTELEIHAAAISEKELATIFADIPFGLPDEPTPAGGGSGAGRAFSVQGYGMMEWKDLFTSRQLLSLGSFTKSTRNMSLLEYDRNWQSAIRAGLTICIDRLADRNSTLAWYQTSAEKIGPTFTRFALPMTWDFAEVMPWADASGGYLQAVDWVAEVLEHLTGPSFTLSQSHVYKKSAIGGSDQIFDVVITDPPYYDAIPYSDLMDFYYIWLKRALSGLDDDLTENFSSLLSPKWDHNSNDGELIDDPSRFEGNNQVSKTSYEDGMYKAFIACHNSLVPDGRLVIVFAHKQPDAWETLVAAIIKAGFVVDGSWPIQTERVGRMRSVGSAALSSSVWLVCRKRPESARPGWDNRVLEEMRANIGTRLHQFWDAGIRGPDFVWAATGPALEAYSQYPVVKKANQPGEIMGVGEFLSQVRRMVVDFVVGRVLSLAAGTSAFDGDVDVDVSSLDLVTTYYLLHRNDFGLNDAPAGPCILYAVSCGLSDRDLADRYDLLARRGGMAEDEDETEDVEDGEPQEEGSGSVFRLKAWNQRKRPNLGYEPGEEHTMARLPMFPEMAAISESDGGYVVPLIDQVHRLMLLWRAGDVADVDDYLDRRALHRNSLFHQLLQALIELSPAGSEERSLLENISNHVSGNGKTAQKLF
jgi:adenine-specific DNA methylase